jgi:16S rRNA (uracil1498-N3)-methyltransferase
LSKDRVRHRFVVSPDAVQGGRVRFPAAIARQMRRVLRLSPGDCVAAFDGTGAEYKVALLSLRDEGATGEIREEKLRHTEPKLKITLCQALLPREKFELVLQKATELGVASFVPLATERSLVPTRALDAGRLERWRRIIQEAAEQAGRSQVPTLADPSSLAEAVTSQPKPALLAWEYETELSIRRALGGLEERLRGGPLTLLVGPEGGFSEAEAAAARDAGAITVSLGPRTLRAETAGPVLAALALYEVGDLEPVRDVGTRGRGDAGTREHGERGDAMTRGRDETGRGDVGTRGRGGES